jgi:pantoate kinase
MRAVAFCPAHITGFFEIRDQALDPLRVGSRGAGICMDRGVVTQVEAIGNDSRSVDVWINGAQVRTATVSIEVAKKLLALSGRSFGLTIHHLVSVPIGSGFGTSGAAAVGIALAGSEALGLNLSTLEAYQIAHVVEVELKTGLGTVAGEYSGGLEVRAKEGAPGYGEIFQVPIRGEYSVVALHNGPLLTSQFLSNYAYRYKINSIGSEFSSKMIKSPSLETFLRLAHEFSATVHLGSPALMKAMRVAEEQGYLFAMAMFGQTVFTIVKCEEAFEVAKIIRGDAGNDGKIIVSPISHLGGRLLTGSEDLLSSWKSAAQ